MSDSHAADSPIVLLIAMGEGLQPIIRTAIELSNTEPATVLLALIGADAAFPFKPRPSTILVPGMPEGVIACLPQLDEFGIASRLASAIGLPGCHDGSVIELAQLWLSSMTEQRRGQTRILASGPATTIAEAEQLGQRFEVSLTSIPMLP